MGLELQDTALLADVSRRGSYPRPTPRTHLAQPNAPPVDYRGPFGLRGISEKPSR